MELKKGDVYYNGDGKKIVITHELRGEFNLGIAKDYGATYWVSGNNGFDYWGDGPLAGFYADFRKPGTSEAKRLNKDLVLEVTIQELVQMTLFD